jgi:hypothetical protein
MRILRLVVLGCVLLLMAACASKEPELAPAEVVTRFYRWCIGYPGNPVVDREYRNNPDLAPSFIDSVDAVVASMDGGGADPLLLAQDIPERFTVDEAEVSGDRATVIVNFYWGGSDHPSRRLVELEATDGVWLITGIRTVP